MKTELQAAVDTREIVPGLWRIRLPFHLELNHVHVFLMRQGSGYLMIDSGFGSAECFAVLEASLASLGVAWSSIHELLLTHGHPDHMGSAARVLDRSGASLIVHEREEEFLAQVAAAVDRPRILDRRLLDWGVPPEQVERVTSAFNQVRQGLQRLTPSRKLQGGEWIQSALGPWQAVWTPGHSPGHICLHHPVQRILISGDHVLEKISPHISWMENWDALAAYLASLEQTARLDVDLVVPSHGDPFQGLAARTLEITRHHHERCAMIRRAQQDGARTVHDLVGALWHDKLSPFQYRFAAFEVMAHLKFMKAED